MTSISAALFHSARALLRTTTPLLGLVAALLVGVQAAAAQTNLIPSMTSNTAPQGVSSASTEFASTYAAWKAMDGSTSTYWATGSGSAAPSFIGYEFASVTVVNSYAITVTNNSLDGSPKTWTFEGWDGAS